MSAPNPTKAQRHAWRATRDLVAARDGWRCRFCRRPLRPAPLGRNHTATEAPRIASLDHWVPRSRGGSDDPSNLVLACMPCNEDKASLTGPEYLTVLAFRRGRAVVVRAASLASRVVRGRSASTVWAVAS